MTNEEKTAALEAFLRGEMSDTEAVQFQQLLQNDPQLQAELALHRELEEALGPSPLNALRDEAAAVLHNRRPPTSRRRRRLLYGLLAILVVLGLLVAWFALRPEERPTNSQLFARYFQPPTELSHPGQLRDGAATRNLRVDSLYVVKNYAAALIELEEQGHALGFQPSSSYYYQLGVLYLANKQAGPALRNLDRIEIGYTNEKQWYRALAFLLSGIADDKAQAELQEIARSDSPFKQDAAELLKKMK